jgi:hypothetical protein
MVEMIRLSDIWEAEVLDYSYVHSKLHNGYDIGNPALPSFISSWHSEG